MKSLLKYQQHARIISIVIVGLAVGIVVAILGVVLNRYQNEVDSLSSDDDAPGVVRVIARIGSSVTSKTGPGAPAPKTSSSAAPVSAKSSSPTSAGSSAQASQPVAIKPIPESSDPTQMVDVADTINEVTAIEPIISEPPKTTNNPSLPLLFFANYDLLPVGDKLTGLWQSEQEPTNPGVNGPRQNTRIQVVAPTQVPGSGANRPIGNAMRVELHPFGDNGDETNTGGYVANRAEVYSRHAVPGSTTPTKWPDPVGSTRWYSYSVYVPPDFAQDKSKWFTLTQFKGYRGGSPPVAIEVAGDSFELGGTKMRKKLGSIRPGSWTRFVIGIHYSPSASEGWVNIYVNGKETIPKTMSATMDMINGAPDPVYLKQGIYRSDKWQATHVLYFGPLKLGTTKEAVN